MGRKLEDQRRQAAEKEAAGRRATDAHVLEDAERLLAAWNEPGQAYADAVLTDDRCRDHGGLLIPVGPVSGLAHHERNRFAHARSPPRCGRPV
jgi:hypothetical protein